MSDENKEPKLWLCRGEARIPKKGEWVATFDAICTPVIVNGVYGSPRLILEPIPDDSILVPASEIEAMRAEVAAGASLVAKIGDRNRELEMEIESLRSDLLEARRITTTLDCRYTLGDVADISGNHCPPDKPCERCNNEREIARLRALVSDVAIGLNAARKSAESIGDGISRTWDVSLLLAAAERCDDFWRTA